MFDNPPYSIVSSDSYFFLNSVMNTRTVILLDDSMHERMFNNMLWTVCSETICFHLHCTLPSDRSISSSTDRASLRPPSSLIGCGHPTLCRVTVDSPSISQFPQPLTTVACERPTSFAISEMLVPRCRTMARIVARMIPHSSVLRLYTFTTTLLDHNVTTTRHSTSR